MSGASRAQLAKAAAVHAATCGSAHQPWNRARTPPPDDEQFRNRMSREAAIASTRRSF